MFHVTLARGLIGCPPQSLLLLTQWTREHALHSPGLSENIFFLLRGRRHEVFGKSTYQAQQSLSPEFPLPASGIKREKTVDAYVQTRAWDRRSLRAFGRPAVEHLGKVRTTEERRNQASMKLATRKENVTVGG